MTGPYELRDDRDTYSQARPVEWLFVAEESLPRERILHRNFSQVTIYELKQKVMRLDALRAILASDDNNETLNNVLIIDEINRGNISKIMGELITLLEADKRIGGANELRVSMPYSGDQFGLPPNLYLIGTMNTADRSIAFLDTALRRRFVFHECMPDSGVIRDHVGANGKISHAGGRNTEEICASR